MAAVETLISIAPASITQEMARSSLTTDPYGMIPPMAVDRGGARANPTRPVRVAMSALIRSASRLAPQVACSTSATTLRQRLEHGSATAVANQETLRNNQVLLSTNPRNPEHIPEHSLWVFRKGDRTAEARTRRVPAGPELRIYYNGAFLRSEVVRDGRNLGEVAEGFSETFPQTTQTAKTVLRPLQRNGQCWLAVLRIKIPSPMRSGIV